VSENYLGWKNRDTWNVILWLQNDEGLYNALSNESRAMKRAMSEWSPALAREFCHRWMGDKTPDGIPLSSKDIDWDEVAEAMNEEVHTL